MPMKFNENILTKEEQIALSLRSLYCENGYSQYKMSKFEEYDFYAKTKDFLVSDSVITFTDTNGRLMALRPDVTLSIVRSTRDSDGIKKLYYHENVYRPSDDCFKEIPQVGVEVIGKITADEIKQVLTLACKSLELLSDNYILEISDPFVAACLTDYSDKIRVCDSEDAKYYTGFTFKGYVPGVPDYVLAGGRYDGLLREMGRTSGAIGFAVYLDKINFAIETEVDEYLNIALPKGRLGEKVYERFAKAGYECPELLEKSRKLIFTNEEKKVRYFWVKPSDVAIYVERGAADLGVCGKDILNEYEPAVYELYDMGVGVCRMCVAGPVDFTDDGTKQLRVATKFSNSARKYYASFGRDIDIIHLNGSIEIAPILGLSDVIVDIVETGTTLKENRLEVKEEIYPISARLISNRTGYKFKKEQIDSLIENFGDTDD